MTESKPLLHHFYKAEHFIGTFVGIVFFIIGHIVLRLKVFTPELIYLKSAFVDIERDLRKFCVIDES